MTHTVLEIAEKLHVEEKAARGLITFMLATDPPLARCRGERPALAGHGAKVYEIAPHAYETIRVLLARLS